jgi:hypothetical protein
MTLFKNKFRVASSRLKEWNYSQDGYYFLTICTKNRENWFGEIPIVETRFIASKEQQTEIQHQMQYSELGKIAQRFWSEIPTYLGLTRKGLKPFLKAPKSPKGDFNWPFRQRG